MNLQGHCKLLKIYLNENATWQGHSLYHALVLKFKEMGMAGVTVSRGIEGYGQARRLHTTRMPEMTFELPVIIEVIDIESRMAQAIAIAEEMVNEGLIFVTDVHVLKYGKTIVSED